MTSKTNRGARKGQNRFKKFQDKQILNTEGEITATLNLLRSQKVIFRNLSHLASYVASVISNNRDSKSDPMSATTLTRNTTYRSHLDAYLAYTTDEEPKSKINNLINNLNIRELDSLRDEVSRLHKFIDNHLDQSNDALTAQTDRAPEQLVSTATLDNLCRAISLILESSNGQIIIDQNSGEIVNAWARSTKNRLVVPNSIAKPYIDWQNSFPQLKG